MILAGLVVVASASIPVALYLAPQPVSAASQLNPQGDSLAGLEGRSPGARLVGIAVKATKVGARTLAALPAEEPQQQALAPVFDAPAGDPLLGFPEGTPVMADVPQGDAAVPAGAAPFFFPGTPGGGFAYVPGGGGPGGGPGGGGPGGGPGGDGDGGTPPGQPPSEPPPVEPPPPVAAVPEPGTWLLMILGFGAIGGAMRRRAREDRQAVKA